MFTVNITFVSELEDTEFVLNQLQRKIEEQLYRKSNCVCKAPESADQIRNENGNVIGTIAVTKEE